MYLVTTKKFDHSKIVINKIYTRSGDSGSTSLADGGRVSKDSLRVEAFGTIDELIAFVGSAAETAKELSSTQSWARQLVLTLRRIQQELFNLGNMLARTEIPPDSIPVISERETVCLEDEIDQANQVVPPLSSFVLPGGSRLNTDLHLCRVICRRAERAVVRLSREESVDSSILHYLNRLGDAFFAWSRWANSLLKSSEMLWDPNFPSSVPPQNGS